MKPVLALLLAVTLPLAAKNTCLDCHSLLEGKLQTPATEFRTSVHFQEGFTCANCHGGDPDSDDPTVAMSPAHGFVGIIPRTAIPKLCAHCHGDPNFMRRYNPSERVDQYAQYVTSVHGQQLAKGDTKVAVCVDCHGTHGIVHVRDPQSPVYPLRLPGTCAHCHANQALMAQYKLPADQYAQYIQSVHWEQLSKVGDLSAPTCSTCHGDHGAKPPAVSSVAAVCGTCHVFEEELFEKSPHGQVFSGLPVGPCVVCHSNHKVVKTSDQMLVGDHAVCNQCHEPASAGGKTAAEMASLIGNLQNKIAAAGTILAEAQNSGIEVSEAILRQTDARQSLVKARANVHAFALPMVSQPVKAGLAIAVENYKAGVAALRERETRRIGLVVSLALILVTLIGLWLTARQLRSRR
jgi:hypothetical protein